MAGIGVCLLLAGCGGPKSNASPNAKSRNAAPEPVVVTVAAVELRPIQRSVHVVGTFYGFDEVTVTPRVEGRVAKIYHDVGDVVEPGDVLMEIDAIDYELAVEEARKAMELELAKLGLDGVPPQRFDVAEIPTVVRARLVAQNAASKLERAKGLFIKKGISQDELEQIETDYKVAEATKRWTEMETQSTLAAARHKQALLAIAEQRLKETKVRVPDPSKERQLATRGAIQTASLAEQTVKKGTGPICAKHPPGRSGKLDLSPFSLRVQYVVAQRLVSEGEMVRAFPSVAVFRVVIDRPLKMLGTLAERHVGEVQVGQQVALSVEAYPAEVFSGTVSRVSPTVDRANRTFQIEVLVPNEDRRLKAGSFARAKIRTREDSQARTIPEEAIVTFAGVTKVFVIQEGKAHAVAVKPGVRLEVPIGSRVVNWVEVVGELSPGSQVVTSGQSQLAEGTAVRVRSPDALGVSPVMGSTQQAQIEH